MQIPPSLESLWREASLDPVAAFHSYTHASIILSSVGDVPITAFRELLVKLGINTTEPGHLHVVLADSYLSPQLEHVNKRFLTAHQPWLLVKPIGRQIWLGPLFYPGETGCWHCLRDRLVHQQPLYQLTKEEKTTSSPLSTHTRTSSTTTNLAFHLTSVEILKWFGAQSNHPLFGAIRSYDIQTQDTQIHTLTRRPQCPVCGDQQDLTGEKKLILDLHNQKKLLNADGGSRTVDPQTTFEKYKHHISPISGIVKYVEAVPMPHPGVHLYSAGFNLRTVSNQPADLPALLRDQSAGKGFTAEQARTSALCEALERYSGIYQGNEPRILASLNELGDDGIHPNQCMLFSEAQYADRDDWHTVCNHPFQHVPRPFDSSARIEWSPLWSLTLQRVRYLPTAYCYYNYKGPHPDFCRADSNGNAAGNTIEEAILQGFFEVVERDCVSTWWYNQLQQPAVALDSFNNPHFNDLNTFYSTIHRELWVIDLTADLNIPTFAAVSRRTDRQPEDIIFGFGAHLHAETAIKRALTEMNQLLPFVINQNLEGATQYGYEGNLELKWWQTAKTADQNYLQPDPNVAPRTAQDYNNESGSDLLTDIEQCVKEAGRLSLETLVLDQTRPDVTLPVVKVVIPGMRVFWKRLAQGRLYSTPVKMGWLDTPTPEHHMNPFPFFL